MGSEIELHQATYSFLRTQIEFGFYRPGDTLPAMEELCRQAHISLDTVKLAYQRLQDEGYISLLPKAGARVIVKYDAKEVDRHIQVYFAQRKTALLDLSQALPPLLSWAQWLSLKHSPAGALGGLEKLASASHKSPNLIWRHIQLMYGDLGNELFMRLLRHMYLYFQGPFYSVPGNEVYFDRGLNWQRKIATYSSRGQWDDLAQVLQAAHNDLSHVVMGFYTENIAVAPLQEETSFKWSAYKKSSQLRYTLAIGLLTDISRGVYPPGSYLPPAERLAAEKGVSLSTVRRAIALLNSLGAVKSSRTLGARVLPPAESTENCDFTQANIGSRLLDMTAGLQIYALSAKAVAKITLSALDDSALGQWQRRLSHLQNGQRYELVTYTSLELIAQFAPYSTIRSIYAELLRLLFWGNPLRGKRGKPEDNLSFFNDFFNRMLKALATKDFSSFAAILEELLLHELRFTADMLKQLGLREVDSILIPEPEESWDWGEDESMLWSPRGIQYEK